MAIITQTQYKGIDLPQAYIKVHPFISIEIYLDEDSRKSGTALDFKVIELSDDAKKAIYETVLKDMFPNAEAQLKPLVMPVKTIEQVSEEERKEIEGTSQDINYKGDHK